MSEARRVLSCLVLLIAALVSVNVAATLFYHSTGGIGLLDLHGGANLLDSRPGYSAAQAHAMLAGYGPAGRDHHLLLTLLADTVFPAVVALFGVVAIRHGYRIAGAAGVLRRWLMLVPLAYLLSDYTENGLIVALLLGFPTEPAGLATAAVTATAVKTALIGATLAVVVLGYLIAAVRRGRPAVARTGSG